jgi:hypothetical protein
MLKIMALVGREKRIMKIEKNLFFCHTFHTVCNSKNGHFGTRYAWEEVNN